MKTTKTTIKPVIDNNSIKVETPEFPKAGWNYKDADEELREIARYVKKISTYNNKIEENKVKFLYSMTGKVVSGRYRIGSVFVLSKLNKMINDTYNHVIIVYYPIWKELSKEHKVIQLDKLLCKIDIDSINRSDSKEFHNTLKHFGAKAVLESSESINLTYQRISVAGVSK